MRGAFPAFNGLVCTLLVRRGTDEKLPNRGHIAHVVYTEMLLQISREYSGLPNVETLKGHQIAFFYDGLRNELKKHTGAK